MQRGATAGVKPYSWLVWCGVPWFLYWRITELRRSLAENCSIERFAWPLLKTLALQSESSQVGKNSEETHHCKMTIPRLGKTQKKTGFHGGNNNNDQELLNVVKWGRFSPSICVSEAEWCRCCYDFNRTKRCSTNIHCQHKQTSWAGTVSEGRLQCWCHGFFLHLLCSLTGPMWFCLPQPFHFHLPTSELTFKGESGPGYWMPHQWLYGYADCPYIAGWHALLLTSCLCWCQFAVSAGWPCRSFQSFSVIMPFLPNMHWGGFSLLSAAVRIFCVPLSFHTHPHTNPIRATFFT